ncbi:SRR1-domain-containing protein [Infundibulicybe gibba]|nr:SRR1-domain-containing protein [Infundibulicybe gibba]
MSRSAADQPAIYPYTDFTPVKAKKKRKNRVLKDSPTILLQKTRVQLAEDMDMWLPQCQMIIDTSLKHLPFASPRILCLGLGSPTTSQNARVQLAFLLEISDRLQIDRANITLYDPVFTAEDRSLLGDLRLPLLPENRNGHYRMEAPTICFMPHCDMGLYENVLQANWTADQLSKLLLIANRLADYTESNPTQKLESRVPRLLRLAPLLACHPFPVSTSWPTAFNNTSVQYISPEIFAKQCFSDLLKLPGPSEQSR